MADREELGQAVREGDVVLTGPVHYYCGRCFACLAADARKRAAEAEAEHREAVRRAGELAQAKADKYTVAIEAALTPLRRDLAEMKGLLVQIRNALDAAKEG